MNKETLETGNSVIQKKILVILVWKFTFHPVPAIAEYILQTKTYTKSCFGFRNVGLALCINKQHPYMLGMPWI